MASLCDATTGTDSSKSFAALVRTRGVKLPSILWIPALLVPAVLLGACKDKAPPPPAAQIPVVQATPPVPALPLDRVNDVREGSTVVLAKLAGKTLAFVSDEDGGAVRAIDLDAHKEIGSMTVPGRPGPMLLTREGKLLVALRDDAAVAVVEAHADGSLKSIDRIATPQEPVALALTPDDKSLLVASGWSHTLEGFRLATKEKFLSMDVAREPRAILVNASGSRAFVAHGAAGVLETVDLEEKRTKTIDLGLAATSVRTAFGGGRVIFDALIPIDDGLDDFGGGGFRCGLGRLPRTTLLNVPQRFARQGFALARFEARDAKGKSLGERLLLPHTEVMTGDPTQISSGYGGGGVEEANLPSQTFELSIVDPDKAERTTFVQGASASSKDGCQLPRAIAVDATKNVAFVACLGSDKVLGFPIDKGTLAATPTLSVRVASGPNGVAVDPDAQRAVAFSQFDGVLTVFSTVAQVGTTDPGPEKSEIRLTRPGSLSELAAEGRKLFHSGGDPRIAADGRACASCHPDGRDDGLVWSTPNGPRQTIQLAGRVSRPAPFGWMGKNDSLQSHMTGTMKNLKGKGLETHEEDALVAFLTSMKGPPTSWRSLTDEESRGREVFTGVEANCSSCHAEKSGFTDHDLHNVKSATASDTTTTFLVPSLVNVTGSAPYFHDGRFATLEELLDKTEGSMGSTKNLSPEDKRALLAYLRTL